MTVVRAKTLGYCMGVKRAVESAVKTLEENPQKEVYTLGPLIHNQKVLELLKEKGLKVLDAEKINISENSVVIIRAHGTTPSVVEKLTSLNVNVIDSTCPKVHLSQKRTSEYAERGYRIIIAGDRNHGEVTSISSYAEDKMAGCVVVVQNAEEAKDVVLWEKNMLIAQTTFSPEEFSKVIDVLKQRDTNITVFNSICSATQKRQNALKELKDKADAVLVIGGKNSANTRRLYEIALTICSNVALIEDEKEIPLDFYKFNTVALTAGASTPLSTVEAVEKALLRFEN